MQALNFFPLFRKIFQIAWPVLVSQLALTGYGASADQYRSRQSGFDRHLNKPVGYDELVEAIETLCGSVPY